MTLEQRVEELETEMKVLKKQLADAQQSTSCILDSQTAEIHSIKSNLDLVKMNVNCNQ
ncbi:MAG: hypothetical protein PW844_17115 [Pantoea sp.]|uniref:hypothetical protein n=1 Tax=Pantoea sp. TaxID=69393 RepID=UPI00239D635A|nr:hypothetical protein [Pantoea sp.]MDE1188187.1 hypothetical protein [Pantoea sp.]